MSDDDGGGRPAANDAPAKDAAPEQDKTTEQNGGEESGSGGRGAAAATASPGGTRARNAQRDSARRNLDGGISYDGHTTLHGDTFQGNNTVIYQATATQRELRATRLRDPDVDTVLGTYVGTKPRARGTVVLLRGPAGSGRYATALTMLNEPRRRPTMRLDPKTVLAALTTDRLADAAGYVFEGGDGAGLTAFEVQRLDGDLHERGCVLVVTVSDRFTPTDSVLANRVVDMPVPPEPAAVLRAHLNWHGSAQELRLAHLLDDPEVLALLRETARRMEDCASFADAIVRAKGDLDLARRRLELRDSHDFEKWFDELPDLYTKCFSIALAVLNSLPHPAVAEAASALELLLDPIEERQKRSERATPFTTGRSRLLTEVRATVAQGTIETRHGETPAEVVAFVDDKYPLRLLNYVWQEHDNARGPLLDWLKILGEHGSDAVRVAAATATGVLAVASFDFVRARVLFGWAAHEHEWCRDSAALGLELPAGDAALTRTVKELVTTWARAESSELAATAARACGVALAAQDADAALQVLDELIVAEDLSVMVSCCVSLAEWAGGEDAVLRNRGVAAMHDWSVDRDPEKRTAGQFAFLWVAMDLTADDDPWPVLLRHAVADGAVARDVVALWSAALVNPELSEFARRVLATWADTVNSDEAAVTAFVDMCGRTGNRSRAVIRHQARGWLRTDGDTHCPRTAAAVLREEPTR